MPRFPEQLQFRAAPGSVMAVEALAKAEGKRAGDILREALAERLRAADPVLTERAA